MHNKDLILSIDNGTQSLRALIFDLEGNMLFKEQVKFTPYFSEKPGWAEQNPEVFWNALCTACQRLWEKGADKEKIAGIALTTQRGTVINLDKNGNPLRPAIIWLDQRRTKNIDYIKGLWGIIFKLLRAKGIIKYFQEQAESNWIRNNQKEIWEKTDKYLLLSGYLTYKLTGNYTDSVGCQLGYIPFDYKKQKWAAASDWKWKTLGIKEYLMPKLLKQTDTLGYITKKASDETGIPEKLPLIAAAADKACEILGCRGLNLSTGCIGYGTTATINVTSEKYIEPAFCLPPYPAAIPNYYSIEVQIYRGYWMVSWFKKEFGYEERLKAKEKGIETEILFDELIKDIPPGSMGLTLQPYWTPGIKLPGPEAKGAVIGFGDFHTKGHLYRSILEGLAYALREGKERIEKRTKTPINELYISGGGSQSDAAMQITADIFGIPAVRPRLYETSGLGAAIIASVGLNLHKNFESAIDAMTHKGDTFTPNLENHKIYDKLYNEVYKKMYKRLKPLYERISNITGYP
jgi:sugar (pentulose or hexulose) kinase